MKNLFRGIAFIALAVLSCAMHTSCNKEGKGGEYSVSKKSVGPDFVDLYFTGPGSFEVAYVISEEDEPQVNPAIMFMSGDKITAKANSIVRIDKYDVTEESAKFLKQNTTYYLYVCAKLGATYSSITRYEFTTMKYDFEEVLTVVGTYYDGYKIHVTVPDSVKLAGNALRYAMTNKFNYNMATRMLGDTEFDMLLFNGGPDTRFIKNDSTFVITDDTLYEYGKDGELILDPAGSPHIFHLPVVPGEPSVFLVGEFRHGHMSENPHGISWGSEKYDRGYVVPLLDWETGEWNGTLEIADFRVQEPDVLDAELDIKVDVDVTDAHVYFTPDKNIYLYIPLILDMETYNQIVSLLDGDESLLQWYLTSYQATADFIIQHYYDAIDFDATEAFSTTLKGGTDYIILATAMGNEHGTSQAFYKKTFKTDPYTLERPIIQVTPLPVRPDDDTSDNVFTTPFAAAYNIKLLNKDVAGELKGGCYACNYARQWQYKFNMKETYESILATNFSYGYACFSKDELAAINSDEGLDLVIPTLDGEVSRLAVYGHNAEYLFNRVDPDADGNNSPAVADVETPYANALTRVDSDLFESLPGEWTATATLSVYEKDDEGDYQKYNHIHKTAVTISAEAPEIPALTQDVIDIYVNSELKKVDSTDVEKIAEVKAETEAEVREMYEELSALAGHFTEARLTNQNCLLCTGFMDFDYNSKPGRMDTRTPWDLFTKVDYVSVDVAQLYYDFGPKWFLQVQPDGSLAVPFNTALLPPLHEWTGYPNYVGGYDAQSNEGFTTLYDDAGRIMTGYFPVSVNEDRTKITVHPIQRPKSGDDGQPVVENGDTVMVNYYMNVIGIPGTTTEIVAPVVSELVLEKKPFTSCPTCDEIYPTAAPASRVMIYDNNGNAVTYRKSATYKSMTEFKEPIKYKKGEVPVITIDKFNAIMEKNIQMLRESINMNK